MIKNIFITQKFSTGQKGQSLVELALTITILLTLLAGAFDLGNAFLDYIAMRDAAQEGAVYASIFPTVGSAAIPQTSNSNPNIIKIISRVKTSSTNPLNFSIFSDINCDGSSENSICVEMPTPCTGNVVTVSINYRYRLVVPFVGGFLGTQDIPLHTSVTNEILTTACD